MRAALEGHDLAALALEEAQAGAAFAALADFLDAAFLEAQRQAAGLLQKGLAVIGPREKRSELLAVERRKKGAHFICSAFSGSVTVTVVPFPSALSSTT